MPRFFLSRQRQTTSPVRLVRKSLDRDVIGGSHARLAIPPSTTGRQRHERVDLFAFRGNAALKQQSSLFTTSCPIQLLGGPMPASLVVLVHINTAGC
jgi:hypothetical protein